MHAARDPPPAHRAAVAIPGPAAVAALLAEGWAGPPKRAAVVRDGAASRRARHRGSLREGAP
eukprot:8646380-Pyramimonas_sp.AAC.1